MTASRRLIFFSPGQAEAGGCATHASKLTAGLARRGWDVRVVAKERALRRPYVSRENGAVVIGVPGFGSPIGSAAFVLVGLSLGLTWGRGATFLAMQLNAQTSVAAVCARTYGGRCVVMSTSVGPDGEVADLDRRRLGAVHRVSLRSATVLVGQTDFAAAELADLVPADRVAIVPTPAPPFAPIPLTGTLRALYTGRLVKGKKLDRLLEAWAFVAAALPDARLTIAGTGAGAGERSVEDELRANVIASPLLARSVTLTGWAADVQPLLAESDVYVLPSEFEGMSNGLLEACARARVVVASDIPGNRAVLGDDYPFLVAPDDVAGFALALQGALTDDALRAQSIGQITSRASRVSLERVLDQIEQLLVG